jgi:hypothetical protein
MDSAEQLIKILDMIFNLKKKKKMLHDILLLYYCCRVYDRE